MLPALEELAGRLFQLRQYDRLYQVARLLDAFTNGMWDRLNDEERQSFVAELDTLFHIRGWDDWDWKADESLSRVASLVADELRGLKRKHA
jgi:hypothetical protein